MELDSRVYVAGHRGLVGSAICRNLRRRGYRNVVTATRAEVDLLDPAAVDAFYRRERPEFVFLAAARVGGILANTQYPAEFLEENLRIETNVISASMRSGARRLLFLGSSCIYPRLAPQPIREDALLTGPLEPTNQWYAIAKIAGLKLCEAYRAQHGFEAFSAMPTNLYGPGDNFDLNTSHVLPALIRRFHEAKLAKAPSVTLWGSGAALREFLHVDDCADALVFLMEQGFRHDIVNVGTGEDLTINALAELIKSIVGYEGAIEFDRTKPDGTPRKQLDVSRLHEMGWRHQVGLQEGVAATYEWYLRNQA